MSHRRLASTVLASATILAATIAFSTTAASATPLSAGTTAKAAASTAKTYQAADLASILKKANKSLGTSGTVLDNAQVKAKIKQGGGAGGISSVLTQSGTTITPAACGTEFTKALSNTSVTSNQIGSILTYDSTNAVTVASLAGKKLPSSLRTGTFSKLTSLLKSCGTMQITITESGQTVTAGLTLTKVPVTTKADRSVGIEETVSIPGADGATAAPVKVDIVSAVYGNLLITAEATTAASTTASASIGTAAAKNPSLVKAVDAVVAAAK